MIYVALRMLIGDRLKYLGLVAGVAFAALLITQQASIFAGFARQTTAWLRDMDDRQDADARVDLWVIDPQSQMTEDLKPLPDTALDRVRGTDGVSWAVPMAKSYLRARLPDGELKTVRVIGLDDASLVAGPPVMAEGRLADLRRDRGVIVNFTDTPAGGGGELGLSLGERFAINDNEVVVVGAYRARREFFWEPVIYTTYSRVLQIAPPQRRMLSAVLVQVRPGEDVAAVARRIEARTGYRALTGDEFASMTQQWILEKTGILVNFGITIALGFVIGMLVAGQTFYTFVLDNLKHFGALKAMGVGNATLLRMLMAQVITVGTIGFGIGLAGACVTGYLFQRIGLAFEMLWAIPVAGAAAVLICCAAAGAFGMLRVVRLEPAVVFKG